MRNRLPKIWEFYYVTSSSTRSLFYTLICALLYFFHNFSHSFASCFLSFSSYTFHRDDLIRYLCKLCRAFTGSQLVSILVKYWSVQSLLISNIVYMLHMHKYLRALYTPWALDKRIIQTQAVLYNNKDNNTTSTSFILDVEC